MKFKDYYQTLGVAREASDEEIKRAYRRLARKYHPDVSKEADAELRFKEMKEAYEVLKDPKKRSAYDQFGENWQAGQDFQPPPDWGRQYSSSQQDFGDAGHFSDFFESLFGGHDPRAGARFGERGGFHMDGDDVSARIAISLEDAFLGATRQITMNVPRVSADGRRTHERRTLKVRIPKGVTAGQKIRLGDQGNPGMGANARAGDLYLEVEFEPHPIYTVRGRDIHVTLPVAPWEAALGQTVKAPTLAGPVDLKIPAGADSGKRLRLKGRGLPGKRPGDEYVELRIVLPDNMSSKARSLYEQLKREQDFNPRSSLGI